MSRAIGKLVLHHRSLGVAVGTLDAFFVMRCFGNVSPEDINATLKCVDVLKSFRPQGSASIIAIDPTATFPSEETRRAALDVTRKTSGNTAAQVMVVLGDGFWASAIRGILTTIASLSHPTYPRKVVRFEEEGIDFAIEAIGESSQKYRTPLLSALSQLKAMATVPPPSTKSPPPPSKAAPPPPRSAPLGSKSPPPSKRRTG